MSFGKCILKMVYVYIWNGLRWGLCSLVGGIASLMAAVTAAVPLVWYQLSLNVQLTAKLEQQQSFRRAWRRSLKQAEGAAKAVQDVCRAFTPVLSDREQGITERESEFNLVPHNCGLNTPWPKASVFRHRYFKAGDGEGWALRVGEWPVWNHCYL